jgi:hypothetical protein
MVSENAVALFRMCDEHNQHTATLPKRTHTNRRCYFDGVLTHFQFDTRRPFSEQLAHALSLFDPQI